MKKEMAQIHVSVYVTCPHCDSYIDLMQLNEFIDDGFIYSAAFGDSWGCRDFNEECECQDCGECFIVESIEY